MMLQALFSELQLIAYTRLMAHWLKRLTTGADGTFTSGDVLTKTELTTWLEHATAGC